MQSHLNYRITKASQTKKDYSYGKKYSKSQTENKVCKTRYQVEKTSDPLSLYDLRISTVTNKELIIVKKDLFYSKDHFTNARWKIDQGCKINSICIFIQE